VVANIETYISMVSNSLFIDCGCTVRWFCPIMSLQQVHATNFNSETVQDGGKLVLITSRMSYMSFRLVSKSVTLNDLERQIGPYFALFFTEFGNFRGVLRTRG